jgi:hypothetical protein
MILLLVIDVLPRENPPPVTPIAIVTLSVKFGRQDDVRDLFCGTSNRHV